jgi:uroporphyrinogen decarboxylase
MVPARRTGKPFWDLYLYKDPPVWQAYIDCAKHFDIDALMDGYFGLEFPFERTDGPPRQECIIESTPERIVTQRCTVDGRRRTWADSVTVYRVADPPVRGVAPVRLGLPPEPSTWEPVEGVRPDPHDADGLRRCKERMGDQGLVGVSVISSLALANESDVFDYYDHPERYERLAEERVERAERRLEYILSLEVRPDFLCVGASGTLIFQTVDIFRRIAFPAVRRVIELAVRAGIPTHVHSCGPEKELVRIFAEETDLTVIDPLEPPPMGDCDLGEIKRLYGDRIVLKGNLHTTNVMLRGTPADVAAASKQALDDAAEGGRFILSTGDQCGRDTPDENLVVMVETARDYGRY